MKTIVTIAAAAGLLALSACNQSPREDAADNIEANAEMTADNMEEMADNATTDAAEGGLENQAEATREAGENAATDMRTNDPDTNTANGM